MKLKGGRTYGEDERSGNSKENTSKTQVEEKRNKEKKEEPSPDKTVRLGREKVEGWVNFRKV